MALFYYYSSDGRRFHKELKVVSVQLADVVVAGITLFVELSME